MMISKAYSVRTGLIGNHSVNNKQVFVFIHLRPVFIHTRRDDNQQDESKVFIEETRKGPALVKVFGRGDNAVIRTLYGLEPRARIKKVIKYFRRTRRSFRF